MNKITEDLQDAIDGILLRKGHLNAKDVDSVKRVLNEKMREAGIDSNRFFTNITILKETKTIDLSEEDRERLSERLLNKTD